MFRDKITDRKKDNSRLTDTLFALVVGSLHDFNRARNIRAHKHRWATTSGEVKRRIYESSEIHLFEGSISTNDASNAASNGANLISGFIKNQCHLLLLVYEETLTGIMKRKTREWFCINT